MWLAVDLLRPIHTDLRNFDPEEVARLDAVMWRSYYDKQSVRMFGQLATLLRSQYGMPFARSNLVAFYAAKAAFVFKNGHGRPDYERALPDLVKYYAAIKRGSTATFDVNRAARLELEWWIVHRERLRYPPGALEQSLADLAAEIYQLPAGRFAEHARYRAQAMVIRDDLSEGPGVSDPDWQTIQDLLTRSWTSLWHAVNG